MKNIVISLGGSVILSEDLPVDYFKKLNELLNSFTDRYRIFIVAGGGKTARTYIKMGRAIGFDEKTLDELGVEATRINAFFLSKVIDGSNKKIPLTTDEAKKIKDRIVIMGGTTPGHSTDMVGAELAEKTRAVKYIIATDVDGVYDRDPKVYPNAKQLDEVSVRNLIKNQDVKWDAAGKNMIIDGPALVIISRARIPTFVLNGKKLDEIKKVINNQKFNGTIIKT